jgi:hypothetical protein
MWPNKVRIPHIISLRWSVKGSDKPYLSFNQLFIHSLTKICIQCLLFASHNCDSPPPTKGHLEASKAWLSVAHLCESAHATIPSA